MSQPLVVVENGQLAIDYLAGQGPFSDREKNPLPCLALLDLKLPLKGGFEVLSWIRQHPTLHDLNVVIVTSSSLVSDMARGQRLGITDYLVKPATPMELAEIIRKKSKQWLG